MSGGSPGTKAVGARCLLRRRGRCCGEKKFRIPVLETKPYTGERLPVLGRSGDSSIDPAVQNDVIADGVGESTIHRSDPPRVSFGADGGEELDVTIQPLSDRMMQRNGIDVIEVVALVGGILVDIHFSHGKE